MNKTFQYRNFNRPLSIKGFKENILLKICSCSVGETTNAILLLKSLHASNTVVNILSYIGILHVELQFTGSDAWFLLFCYYDCSMNYFILLCSKLKKIGSIIRPSGKVMDPNLHKNQEQILFL